MKVFICYSSRERAVCHKHKKGLYVIEKKKRNIPSLLKRVCFFSLVVSERVPFRGDVADAHYLRAPSTYFSLSFSFSRCSLSLSVASIFSELTLYEEAIL